MELVKIVHPDPEVADTEVLPEAVDHHRRAGWRPASEIAEEQAATEPPADPAPDKSPALPRRRTTNEEGKD